MLALCLAGPLAGPYGALFGAATGSSASAWQEGWTAIPAWSGPGAAGVSLGLARLPVIAGAIGCLLLLGAELLRAAGHRGAVGVLHRRLHLPLRRHGFRGVTS